LRDLRDLAHRDGAAIKLVARALSHPLGTHGAAGCSARRATTSRSAGRTAECSRSAASRSSSAPPAARVEVEASMLRSF